MKEKLTSCVSRMEELRKEPELPEDPAERFEKLMEAVPGKKDKVWNTDGAAIDAARACYDEIDLKTARQNAAEAGKDALLAAHGGGKDLREESQGGGKGRRADRKAPV